VKERSSGRGREQSRCSPVPRRRKGLTGGAITYRLADGKIVAQDVMTDPDLTPVLGPLLAPPDGP
jgi:hypothetical protein